MPALFQSALFRVVSAVACPLFIAASCDEPLADDADDADDAEVSFRTCPGGGNCLNSATFNDVSTPNHGFNGWNIAIRDNADRWHRFTGATCRDAAMASWDVTALGELRFKIASGGWNNENTYRGTEVDADHGGCVFTLQVATNSTFTTGVVTSHMTIYKAVPYMNSDNSTTGWKYYLTVPKDLRTSGAHEMGNGEFATCFDNPDKPDNWYMSLRAGLTLGATPTSWANVSDRAAFVCHASVAGHPSYWGIPHTTNADETFARSESVAIAQYFDSTIWTHTGNPIMMGHNGTGAPGYANWSSTSRFDTESMSHNGAIVCRGGGASYGTHRNAETYYTDWDQIDTNDTLPHCSLYLGPWTFMTIAPCSEIGDQQGSAWLLCSS